MLKRKSAVSVAQAATFFPSYRPIHEFTFRNSVVNKDSGDSTHLYLGWLKTHLFCNRVYVGRSRSSKVVDFGTNRKGNLLLVLNSSLTLVLSCTVSELGNLLAENCEFFLSHSHLARSLGVNPFEFLDELFIAKTRVLGISVGEDFVK